MTETIITALEKRGYKTFLRPCELNIVGIRSSNLTPNTFNDSINVLYKDEKGQWQYHSFPATTDPGTFWLKNPANPQGTAILKAGQYLNSHIIGLHRNKYTALVQRNPVTVIRDIKRDGTLDLSGIEDRGLFGINIHRALQEGTTKYIDKFSAGCQVFANAADFNTFMALCEKHKALYGNSFTYTLLHETELLSMAA
ncbi:MAG: hypothetical protein ACHQD8_01320 [Chitinophagales bacterium]